MFANGAPHPQTPSTEEEGASGPSNSLPLLFRGGGRGVVAALALLTLGTTSPPPASSTDGQAQWAQRCKDWDDWNKPGPPFHVFGNTYYVGTCGISAILIDSPEGAVVIDGGPADAGGLVAKNIQALGIELSHVKLLLHSHEHHDHVGGLAELKRLTGADLYASARAAQVLASGKPGADDPQFAGGSTFPPVEVKQAIAPGEVVFGPRY